MSEQCTINHRNDATRARCQNAQCRQRAARARAAAPGGSSSVVASRVITVPDAHGKPISIDLSRPRVRNCTLSPASVAAMPKGVTFDRCTFAAGEYLLEDATMSACKTAPDSVVCLGGNSFVESNDVRGNVFLDGETFSRGNIYHGLVVLGSEPQSTQDHFAQGYMLTDDSNATIDHQNTTYGEGAGPSMPGAPVEHPTFDEIVSPGGVRQPARTTNTTPKQPHRPSVANVAVQRIARVMVMSMIGGARKRGGFRSSYR